MTPLFAPRPARPGAGFGPDFGERRPGWGPPAQARSAHAPPEPKPDPWAPPPWPMGGPVPFGGLGVLASQGHPGRRFGDIDPWTEPQIRPGAASWPGPGRMVR